MYNPSAWKKRRAIIFVAMIATSIALFLGLYQWHVIHWIWDPIFGDNGTMKVLSSALSHDIIKIIHIPDAIVGAFAYFCDVAFALIGSNRRWKERPWIVILFGISVIPVGIVSILLVLAQGLIVKHWCFWCFLTAICSLVLIFLAYDEVSASCTYLQEIKKRGGKKLFWRSFWGYPCAESSDAAEAVLQKRRSSK